MKSIIEREATFENNSDRGIGCLIKNQVKISNYEGAGAR